MLVHLLANPSSSLQHLDQFSLSCSALACHGRKEGSQMMSAKETYVAELAVTINGLTCWLRHRICIQERHPRRSLRLERRCLIQGVYQSCKSLLRNSGISSVHPSS
jgi:hypothetical protein